MTSASDMPAAGSPSPGSLHPSMVLTAYLEPLVRGRRVAVLGDVTIGLADQLLLRGARLVHAYDPAPARVAEVLARSPVGRQPHPSFAVLDGDLGVRDGAFDTLVIPDLSLFPDPAEILRRTRRLLAANGTAVVTSPNPDAARRLVERCARRADAPGYYALYDLVSLQWKHVRMIGQAPFIGYTVADFAPDGEPEVSVDTSLLDGSEEPEWFIALAGDRPVRLDAFSVIELPFADFRTTAPGVSIDVVNEAEARAMRLGGELEELRQRAQRDREDAGARAESAVATAARLAEVESELTARNARLKEIEARAGDSHVRAERLSHQIRDMEEELRHQRDRATRLAKQLDDEKRARTKVELELGMIRNKPEIAGAKDRLDAMTADLDAARIRIVELEARALPVAPDPALLRRIEELEAAAVAAQRELVRTASERDATKRRVEDAEIALDDAQRARREAIARHAELSVAHAELGRDRAALEEKTGLLAREKRALEEQCNAQDARRKILEARIAELEHRVIELEQQSAELEKRDAGEAAAAEIAALEEALRERGHVIAALQAELRESERVGKELVDELGSFAQAAPEGKETPGAPPGAASPGNEGESGMRQQLDALARNAAAREADLRAAGWKIAQLERELAEARDATSSPASLHQELEQALVAARAEIASLRRSTPAAAHGESFQVAPDVVEQAILLQQVAGAVEAGL